LAASLDYEDGISMIANVTLRLLGMYSFVGKQ
jgi:hypothetical protein